MSSGRRLLLALASLLLAGAIYLPCVHLFFRPAAGDLVAQTGVAPLPGKLAARQIRVWTNEGLLQAELPQARFETVAGYGHLFPQAAPAATRAILEDWLRGVEPEAWTDPPTKAG